MGFISGHRQWCVAAELFIGEGEETLWWRIFGKWEGKVTRKGDVVHRSDFVAWLCFWQLVGEKWSLWASTINGLHHLGLVAVSWPHGVNQRCRSIVLICWEESVAKVHLCQWMCYSIVAGTGNTLCCPLPLFGRGFLPSRLLDGDVHQTPWSQSFIPGWHMPSLKVLIYLVGERGGAK